MKTQVLDTIIKKKKKAAEHKQKALEDATQKNQEQFIQYLKVKKREDKMKRLRRQMEEDSKSKSSSFRRTRTVAVASSKHSVDSWISSEGSQSDSDREEVSSSAMKCMMEVSKMLGNDLDIAPAHVDLAEMRVLTHTPKTGEYREFDKKYYEENMRANDFLRTFVTRHIDATGTSIDKLLGKPWNYMIKNKLTANAPMRQAYKQVKREEKIAKKMKAAGRHGDITQSFLSPSTMRESDYSRSPVNGLTPSN